MSEQPHVLVVDDDAKIAAALRRALIYEGYQVEVAPDGHIALADASGGSEAIRSYCDAHGIRIAAS